MKNRNPNDPFRNPLENVQWGPVKERSLLERWLPWVLAAFGIILFAIGYHHMMFVCVESDECIRNSIVLGPRHWDDEFMVYGLLTLGGSLAWRAMQK